MSYLETRLREIKAERRIPELNSRGVLRDSIVREMRSVYLRWKAAGDKRGYQSLGEIFGVSQWTVRDIVTYRTRIDA